MKISTLLPNITANIVKQQKTASVSREVKMYRRVLQLLPHREQLTKLGAYIKTVSKLPESLKGKVRPEDAVTSFDELLSGYREGLQSIRKSRLQRAESGLLTHDTRTHGGLEAMDDILRSGKIRPSSGENAQYTLPGLSEVYWHRGIPGYEFSRPAGGGKPRVSKMWFRGTGAEGIHANLTQLAKENRIAADRLQNVTNHRNPHIARTSGPYSLRKGDFAVLSSEERKNLPDMLSLIKDRELRFVDSGIQQEALRAAQMENFARGRGWLKPGQNIRNLPEDYLDDIADMVDDGILPRQFNWWGSAKPVTDSRLEELLLKNLAKSQG